MTSNTKDIIDFSEEIAAIKARHGERYFVEPAAMAEAAALWGAECNDCGVALNNPVRFEFRQGGWIGGFRLHPTTKGYWLIAVHAHAPESGFSSPASVWDCIGYANELAARAAAVDEIATFIARAASRYADPAPAKAVLKALEAERFPQLELF